MENVKVMKIILPAIALALWVSAVHAAEPFDFKGVPLGSTEQELLEKHPEFSCKDDPDQLLGDRQCYYIGTYAGVEASTMIWFYSNSLGQIYITFKSDLFDEVNSALVTKYGKPTTVVKEKVRNAMGANFLNEINTWKRKSGLLVITKLAGEISQSSVDIQSIAFRKEYTLRQQRKIKAGSGDI